MTRSRPTQGTRQAQGAERAAARTGDDAGARRYTVGEVAGLAGVSVRTLRHYNAIGLLAPLERSESGYRLYGPRELDRLGHVLAYRKLGFELDAIRALLDDPAVDRLGHLRRQQELLDERARRIEAMRAAVRKMTEATRMGIDLDPEEMLEAFGDFDPTEHAAEAEERWGGTDAYRESQARTRRYRKEDWLRIREESQAIERRLADAMAAGAPPDDARAADAAEAHRQHIVRWFYGCSREMHAGLADLVEADPRFAAHWEERAPGLARYVVAAFRANASRG